MPYTGVPRYIRKTSVWVPEYPLLNRTVNHATTRAFYVGFLFYSTVLGAAAAYWVTESSYGADELSSRPDYLPFRAMVREDYIPIKEKKVLEFFHGNYFGKPLNNNPQSLYRKIVRYLYPQYDYKPDEVYYAPHFDYTKDYQSENWSNHYHFKQ